MRFNDALPLFDSLEVDAPPTEGIKYAGSKLKLIPHILQLAKKTQASTVLDGFSGTTRVSQALARRGYKVISNDRAAWSEIFGVCYLLNKKPASHYSELIRHLNSVAPRDGWFTEHYGSSDHMSSKRPWQTHNTRKLDGIREEIEQLKLDSITRAVAITSLIMALDRVDSTLGHYASYLKDWSPRSFNNVKLQVPMLWESDTEHRVCRSDIFDLLPSTSIDLAYFDPPYGSNNEKMPPSRVRYSAYYHIWTSVCLFDRPSLFGKANRRTDTSDCVDPSVFEEYRRTNAGKFVALEALEQLLQKTNSQWIILSYSSGGRATALELHDLIRSCGDLIEVCEIDHRRNVMAEMRWTNEWIRQAEKSNREFLFLLRKR